MPTRHHRKQKTMEELGNNMHTQFFSIKFPPEKARNRLTRQPGPILSAFFGELKWLSFCEKCFGFSFGRCESTNWVIGEWAAASGRLILLSYEYLIFDWWNQIWSALLMLANTSRRTQHSQKIISSFRANLLPSNPAPNASKHISWQIHLVTFFVRGLTVL